MDEPPIQNPDRVDLVGARNDGGLDLIVVAAQLIDNSAATIGALRQKLRNYLTAACDEDFGARHGRDPGGSVRILVVGPRGISPEALAVIDEMRKEASAVACTIEFREHMRRDT